MNMCLRRLIGWSTSGVFRSSKTTDYINTRVCNYYLINKNTADLPRNAFSSSSLSQASSFQGLVNEVGEKTKNTYGQLEDEKGRYDLDADILASEEKQQQPKIIEKGDIVNLSGLVNEVGEKTKNTYGQLEDEKGRCDLDADILASEEKQQQPKIIEKGDIVNLSGLDNEVGEKTKNTYGHLEDGKGRRDCDADILASEEQPQPKIIEKGDIVNLSELLFTKNRNYLIKYDDPQLVTADQLAGKVVVIYFVRDDPYSSSSRSDTFTPSLIDIYNDLKHENCFEVVFVFVDDAFISMESEKSFPHFLQGKSQSETQVFEDIFSRMPWTAVPFSDIALRKILEKRFGLQRVSSFSYPIGIVIDTTGKVLQTRGERIFDNYGSPAYPFSDSRLALIDFGDKVIAEHPSLNLLLASRHRDYVISNKGDMVPIQTLEDKVVALYFYEDDISYYNPTEELIMAYEWLAESNRKFEVVLIYLSDMYHTYKCTNEETFKKTFKTMPWLALPFKDPTHKKLKRLFNYPRPMTPYRREKAPRLVIFGPHGEFIEPCGAELLLEFGVSAYPFTRENLVKLETKKVMELKLEMLCSPTTIFRRKDGSQVQSFHFVGKRVIFYFESYYWDYSETLATVKDEVRFVKMLEEVEFLRMLKERYLQMKGTDEEFEVIYIPYRVYEDKFCYSELVADLAWFVSPLSELLPGGYDFFTYYGKNFYAYECSFLLAFGQDGRLVRRTICPKFQHKDFPFYAGSLEDEAYHKLSRHLFSDGYWNMHYEGLLKNSFETK